MMLRHSFNLLDEAKRIEDAVNDTLKAGYRTKDIYTQGDKLVSTSEMADQIIAHTSEAGNASPK
jgi:3-isopropylmalate dehydrogenase